MKNKFLIILILVLITGCRKEILKNKSIYQSIDDIDISIAENTLTSSGANIILKNNTDEEYEYGPEYTIEVKTDNKWNELKPKEILSWNAVIYTLKAKETKEYHLVKKIIKKSNKEVYDSYIQYISVNFEIK